MENVNNRCGGVEPCGWAAYASTPSCVHISGFLRPSDHTTPPRFRADGRGAMLDGTCVERRNGAGRPTDLAMERRRDHHDGIWHTTTANTTTVAQAIAQGFAQRVTRRIDGMRGGGIDYGRAIGCGGGGAWRDIDHGQISGLLHVYAQRRHVLDGAGRLRFHKHAVLLHRGGHAFDDADWLGLPAARFAAEPAARRTVAQIPACAQQRLHADGARNQRWRRLARY